MPSNLTEQLRAPIDHRVTRHILEIRFPILHYLLIDEQEHYHLIGRPGLPGGHFQVGRLDRTRREWTPAPQQQGIVWEQTPPENQCVLHRITMRHGVEWETAFVQHNPTYRSVRGGEHHLDRVDQVEVGLLWLPGQKWTCSLTVPCGCHLYQSLLETRDVQWR